MFHLLGAAHEATSLLTGPSHLSISMRQELLAIPEDIGVMKRDGESTFTQPPRSEDSPGTPMGSYSAHDS